MGDILRERGLEANTDNGATLALELQEKGGFGGVFHAMHEDDVRRIMAHPRTMISSDGGIVAPGRGGTPSTQLRHLRAGAEPLRARGGTPVPGGGGPARCPCPPPSG